MSEVKRFFHTNGDFVAHEEVCWIAASDFDRVVAERDALQSEVAQLRANAGSQRHAPTLSDNAIAALRDELQASQCAEQLLRDELRETAERVDALVAGIRQWASECAECGGTGRADYGPCPDCGDIRALLPNAPGEAKP